MLPVAHLTLHSKMSGFRWVITPSWLSGSQIFFLYSSYVCSWHLFLISFASVRSIIVPIFAWNILLVSLIFLKRSLVFPILLFSSISLHWSLVFPILLFSSISLHWSLRKAVLSLLAILWNSAFRCLYLSFSPLLFASLLFTAICKASSDSHVALSPYPVSFSSCYFSSLTPHVCLYLLLFCLPPWNISSMRSEILFHSLLNLYPQHGAWHTACQHSVVSDSLGPHWTI